MIAGRKPLCPFLYQPKIPTGQFVEAAGLHGSSQIFGILSTGKGAIRFFFFTMKQMKKTIAARAKQKPFFHARMSG